LEPEVKRYRIEVTDVVFAADLTTSKLTLESQKVGGGVRLMQAKILCLTHQSAVVFAPDARLRLVVCLECGMATAHMHSIRTVESYGCS
jgi:hypothetical protein